MRLLKEVCNLHKHPKNTRKCFIVIKIDQYIFATVRVASLKHQSKPEGEADVLAKRIWANKHLIII